MDRFDNAVIQGAKGEIPALSRSPKILDSMKNAIRLRPLLPGAQNRSLKADRGGYGLRMLRRAGSCLGGKGPAIRSVGALRVSRFFNN